MLKPQYEARGNAIYKDGEKLPSLKEHVRQLNEADDPAGSVKKEESDNALQKGLLMLLMAALVGIGLGVVALVVWINIGTILDFAQEGLFLVFKLLIGLTVLALCSLLLYGGWKLAKKLFINDVPADSR